jgi:hypothetical protein
MAVKPVKVLTDLLTKKQILKQDLDGNVLFRITGSLNSGFVSSSLPITGSSGYFPDLNTVTSTVFDNIAVVTSSLDGRYNVDQAFHAIDTALNVVSGIINSGESQASAGYKRLRYREVGFFSDDGTAEVILPKTQLGGPAFPLSSMDFINLSVMIKDGDAWTNDLLSINIVSGGISNDEIHVLLDAPALTSADQYRILAVNENPDDYMI